MGLRISDAQNSTLKVSPSDFLVHVYSLHEDAEITEEPADDDDAIVSFSQWPLPCAEFEGVWENLIFESDLKPALLRYAETALLFSDAGIDSNIISCNRVILLHGPAGTGKTSVLHQFINLVGFNTVFLLIINPSLLLLI